MRIADLKKEIEQSIIKHKAIIDGLNGSDNPQAIDCQLYNQHIIETLEAVLSRINGDRIALQLI
ncbi:MAG: hypothetical protein RBR97_20145 [Bacteroidales bacterium]|nr:hypothetical protein [Bacteroidales bacterium]